MPMLVTEENPTEALNRLVGWWSSSEPKPGWAKKLFLAVAVCYFVFIAVAQTGPLNRYANDVFILLDGSWRIFKGQVPYRDFYLALGPLEYLVTAGAMFLTKGGPGAIALGNCAFGIGVGAWGWFLARRRMPLLPSLLAAAWLILTATCSTPLGVAPSDLGCAMSYNRHGYAILAILLMECAFLYRRSSLAGAISSGIALALLAFLKLNFFGCAVVLILASLFLAPRRVRVRLGGILLGFCCGSIPFVAFLRFSIAPYLADLDTAVHARIGVLNLKDAANLIAGSGEVALLTVTTILVVVVTAGNRLRWEAMIRILAFWGLVVLSCTLLAQTDAAEGKIFVLLPLWAILLLGRLANAYPGAPEKGAVSVLALLCIGGCLVNFFEDGRSALALLRFRLPPASSSAVLLKQPGMSRLKFFDTGERESDEAARISAGQYLPASVNDGVVLLDKYAQPSETVLTLGFTNPFAYVERRDPAIGGSPWLHVGNNLSATHLLAPERIFGNAKVMMLLTCVRGEAQLHAAYEPYLVQHFDFVASNRCWSLYRRKQG